MTLDEAIKHAEEVAEKNEKKAKSYPRPDRSVRGSGRKYNDCIECASEHRRLAEWLKELKQLKEQNPCEDPKLISVRQELLDRGDEMVSFRQLVERFDEVEEYFKGIPWNLKQIYNNFNILIGEKPCTDAISRQAVLDYIRDNYRRWFINDDAFIQCMKGIKNFISVTPQSKMGHWEWVQYDYNTKLGDWHCSECRSVVVECVDKNEKGGIPMYKYCPQCGIKMKEVDE